MNLSNAWFIGKKDFRYALRGKEAILWIFVMPIVFFYFIGTVIGGGGFSGSSDEKKPLALYAAGTPGFLLAELTRRLDENGFDVKPVEDEQALAQHALQLRVPSDFSKRVLAGDKTTLEIHRKKAKFSDQLDDVRMGRATYTLLADIVAAAEAGREPTVESFQRLAETPRTLTMSVKPAGERREVPMGFEQAIPGMLVMFTMIVLLTSGTTTLVIERREGLLRRLASTPISRGEIVLGKWLGRLGMAIVQVAVALAFGTFIFGMNWGPDFVMVFVLLLAWAAFCASFGLLLACLARTEAQAVALGVLIACALAALGGCWWPIEITASGMQKLADLIPSGWAMDGMHKLISYRMGPASVLGNIALILAAALLFGWLATKRFRFEDA